jgi:hypothetical protein
MLPDNPTKFAYSIAELAEDGPVGKSTLYTEIAASRLVARKIGRRTFILDSDWRAFLEGAPTITPAAPAPSVPAATTGRRPRGRPRKVPAAPTPTQRVPSENIPEPDSQPPPLPLLENGGSHLGPGRRRYQKTGKTTERGAAE